jgi:hypothetical protein
MPPMFKQFPVRELKYCGVPAVEIPEYFKFMLKGNISL